VNPSPQSWFLLRSKASAAADNMAMDEALLEASPALAQPVLRFYSWTEPAATFGYFQKHAEIEKATHLRPLVRRPTGGGLVPHDADWTYSLVFPPSDPWYSLKAPASYRRIHEWLRIAFQRLDVATELATDSRKKSPGQCFAGYECSDVLWHGRKIAGAAQRRTRGGLLIQGSVQPPPISPPVARGAWEQAMCDVGHIEFGAQWREFKLDLSFAARVAELASKRYAQSAYNRRR
jgi:lipoate-protein ligase A